MKHTYGLYYYALIWACDNTQLKQGIFVCYIDYADKVLIPWYAERGIRMICVGPIEEEVTESILI